MTDRLAVVDQCIADIGSLPLTDKDAFFADRRNFGMAESSLRRALEALFDIGRHILAKGFVSGTTEYKSIVAELAEHGVISTADAQIMRQMAGYRNRLVHFYHEVSPEELFDVCANNAGDLSRMAEAYREWIELHPEKIDRTL